MKKSFLSLLVIAHLVHLISCSEVGIGMKGDGPIVEEWRTTAAFSELVLGLTATVHLTQGPLEEVRILAQQNILENMEMNVQGKRLKISFDNHVRKHEPITIYLTTPDISSITVSGSGTVLGMNRIISPVLSTTISGSGEISLDLEADQLTNSISGSGKIDCEGSTGQQTVHISGSGTLHTPALESSAVDVNISGSGNAYVWATQELVAHISGSGSVIYGGSPRVNSHISGSGTVRPRQ